MEDTSGAKILNVDDDEAGRYAATRILQHDGFEVMEAATGKEALNAALEMPDLILLDVNLPDINGFEVCRRLKSNPATQSIPILHVSATYKDPNSTVNGLEGGADGYLTLPVEPSVLLAHIKALLRSSRLEKRLRQVNRFLKAMSYCNQALLRCETEFDLIQEVCRILVEVAGHRFVWVGACEPDSPETIRPVASWGDDEGLLELTKASLSKPEEDCCPLGEAVTTGKPVLLQDIRIDSRCEPWRTEALKRGFVSAFALPLVVRRSVWGGISICSDTTGMFHEEERELLSQLTNDLAYGIETLRTREEAERAQKELRDSEERFRKLFDAAADAIYVLEAEGETAGKIVSANPAAAEMHGYTVDELLNLSISDLDTPESASRVPQRLERVLKGENLREEVTHRRKDGSVFPLEINACLLELQDRKFILAIDRDITEWRRAEEALYLRDSAVASSISGISILDLDGNVTYVNPAALRLWGYGCEDEVLGKQGLGFWISREQARAAFETTVRSGGWVGELTARRKDGSSMEVQVALTLVRSLAGTPLAIMGWYLDITGRKRMESALKDSEERFRLAFENANIGVCLVDTRDRLIKVNDRMCRILGYTKPELENMTINDVSHPEDLDVSQTFIERALSGEIDRAEFEKRYIHKQGHIVWGHVVSTLGRDNQGKPLYFISHVQDKTQQKIAEDALRESEERYRYIVENIEDLICTHDMKGNLHFVSSAAAHLLGFEAIDMIGRNVRSYLAPEVRDQFDAFLAGLTKQGYAKGYMLVQTVTGEKRLWEYRSKVYVKAGSGPMVLGIARDVTERRRAEQTEKRLVTAIEQATEGVIITDTEGTIQYVNPGLERMTGYSRDEILGQNPRIFKSGEHDRLFYKELWDTIKAGATWTGRLTNRRKDGRLYHEDATISPVKDSSGKIINFVAVKRDITEHLELTRQLLHAQKMEAVGTLAGGVAHDFNNILQVTLGYSDLLLGDEGLSRHHRADLKKINDAAKRGADLVQRLLTFSRKREINLQPLDLNRRITEMRKMLDRTIPKMIDIQLILSDDLAAINADPTQVDQVLMNLAVNARDAMPDGGELIIETVNIIIDDEYARTHLNTKPGYYVLLMVTDTGEGMDKDTLEHIFEPFYTTKGVGEGTGLGLATVHGIVQHHGGHIRCYSEPGRGTTFKVYFPALSTAEESEGSVVTTMPRGGPETVLLVDDEEMIRDLGSRILTKAGYTVITASNGKEALNLYQGRSSEIALVVLDLIMPEMGGKQCLQEFLRINPAIRVIIASGYSANGPTKDALAAGAKGFVNKPYDIRQLLQVVRDVLDEK
ncbi:MAG: PAS domain S-box protein [Desulfomonile sp.]|nr:PAS domain S-box protein [Desulfomonile sp.]